MKKRAAREGGWALVTVAGVLLIIAVIAAGLVSLSLASRRISHAERLRFEAAAIAEAAISRAIAGLLDPRVEHRWRVDDVPQAFEFEGTKISVRIQDELGRIDLNATDGDTLARLLSLTGGLAPDDAAALADKIMDWREADDLRRLNGATKTDYVIAGRNYVPRQGPFQSVDEVKLVLGMDEALFEKIAPALTVYSLRTGVDPQVAPRAVLLALPGQDETRADETLRARAAGIKPAVGPSVYARPGVIDPSIDLGGRSFTIAVAFDYKGVKRTGSATVMLTGDPRRPFLARAWQVQ